MAISPVFFKAALISPVEPIMPQPLKKEKESKNSSGETFAEAYARITQNLNQGEIHAD